VRTLTLAALLYLSVYLTALVNAARYRHPDAASRDSRWVARMHLLAWALGGIGIFLYSLQSPLPRLLRLAWRPAWVGILSLAVVDSVQSYQHLLAKPDDRVPAYVNELGSAISILTWILLELPCLWMNFRVAFPA
jgi:hypothetical protein